MADLSQVMDTLATLLTNVLYPVQPPVAGQCVLGFDVIVGSGWPDDQELNAVLTRGEGFVSLYPVDGERNTTTWEYSEQEVDGRGNPGCTLVYDVPSNAITVSVSGLTADDVIGVAYANVPYTFALTPDMTPASIAAMIVAALPQGAAKAVDNVVQFPVYDGSDVYDANELYMPTPQTLLDLPIAVVTGRNGWSMLNVGSIEKRIRATVWAPDTMSRDALAGQVIETISANSFLNVPANNGTAIEQVNMRYGGSGNWSDKPENAGGYMRSLTALVSFQTTVYTRAYAILFGNTPVNAMNFGPLIGAT